MNSSDDTNCTSLSQEQVTELSFTTGVTAIVCFVICCLTLLLMLFYRGYRTRLQRLFLYLSISFALLLAVNILQISSSNEDYCSAVGFLNQYVLHIVLLHMLGVVYYLFQRVRKSSPGRRRKQNPAFESKWNMYYEMYFVVFTIIFPLTYNWIPFVLDVYGGPPWCWIKLTSEDACSSDLPTFLTVMVVGILPNILVVTICTVVLFIVMVIYCRWLYRFRASREVRSTLTHETGASILLLVVLVTFLIYDYYFLTSAIRFRIGDTRGYKYGLLLANAVFLPVLRLILPVAFVIYLYSFKSEVVRAFKAWMACFKSCTKGNKVGAPAVHTNIPDVTYNRTVLAVIPSSTGYPLQYEFNDEFISSLPTLPENGNIEQ